MISGEALRGWIVSLAFDKQGNLWACNQQKGVVGFASSDLKASGSPTPVASLARGRMWMSIAFDSRGDLWLADFLNGRLVVYAPGELAKPSGSTPSWVIYDYDGRLFAPMGLAFDNRGRLWAVGQNVVVYSPEQLLVTGAPAPICSFTELGTFTLAFDPAPAELPIYP